MGLMWGVEEWIKFESRTDMVDPVKASIADLDGLFLRDVKKSRARKGELVPGRRRVRVNRPLGGRTFAQSCPSPP